MASGAPHLLRLVLSSRRLTAEVTAPRSATIVAMASSEEEPDFAARLARFPGGGGGRRVWDAGVAARVGTKLGFRLRDRGIAAVEIDAGEELLARPPQYRRPLVSLLDAVKRAGVHVAGAEKLSWP